MWTAALILLSQRFQFLFVNRVFIFSQVFAPLQVVNFLFEKVVLLLQQQVPLLKCLKLSALLLHLLGVGRGDSLMIDSHSRNLSVVPWWSLVV